MKTKTPGFRIIAVIATFFLVGQAAFDASALLMSAATSVSVSA